MKITHFDSNEDWLAARVGKITGSSLKDIVVKRGTGKKIGFFQLIADRIALPADGEDAMARGHRLEPEAIARFEAVTKKKVDTSLVMWTRSDNENIAVSPDGFIGKHEAVEVKALSSARHLEAVITNTIPDEYEMQVIQYFAVNDELKKLYFVLYDPRLKVKDFHVIEVTRKQVQEQVKAMLEYQEQTLKEIDKIVKSLSF